MAWPCRIKCNRFLVLFSLSLVTVLLWYSTVHFQSISRIDDDIQSTASPSVKTILLWNADQRKEVRVFGIGSEAFREQGCQFDRCQITSNRSERPLESYDAIIVNFNDEFVLKDFPELGRRRQHQRYVFFTQESPAALAHLYDFEHYKNDFNWTMTYRTDSDIPFLYGRIIPEESAPRTVEEVMSLRAKASSRSPSNKTKTIAWMVSHCDTDSQREKYVEQLKKYIRVDIYGGCGNLTCARHILHHSDPQCYDMLQSTYKFYLSFENSLCPDYVTEKFFKIMDHDILPVVYGGADYSQYSPPHSYIDAGKFKPEELAAYLNLLDKNDSLYNEYFWWKDHYRVESSVNDMARHGFCDLCRRLHENTGPKTNLNFVSDWNLNSCKRPSNFAQ